MSLGQLGYEEATLVEPLHEERPPARSARLAILILGLCCVFWGFSFPVMQLGSSSLDQVLHRVVPQPERLGLAAGATFNGWRFGLAALVYWLITRSRQRRYSPQDWGGGLVVGAFFTLGMFMQLTGLRYTLPSISAFLTALAVLFVPLGQAMLFRKRVGPRTWMAVGIALAGMVILSRKGDGAEAANTMALLPPLPYLGETLTVLGAALFAGQILAVGHFGQTADPTRLTFIMLFSTAIASTVGGLALGGQGIYRLEVFSALLHDVVFVAAMLSLILLSTVLALHLMNTYQPLVCAATASVIYCLEPVFATLWSVLFRTEGLVFETLAGGTIILAAVLLVAWPMNPLRSGRRESLEHTLERMT